jgi:hypothetical protein
MAARDAPFRASRSIRHVVEVVATYKLYNINRTKLENLIRRIFGTARLEIEIPDRFGRANVHRPLLGARVVWTPSGGSLAV